MQCLKTCKSIKQSLPSIPLQTIISMKINKDTILKFFAEEHILQSIDFDFLNSVNNSTQSKIPFDCQDLSANLIQFVIDHDTLLTAEQKATLIYVVNQKQAKSKDVDFWKQNVKGLTTIIELFEAHLKPLKYNFDYELDGKKIPVYVDIKLVNGTRHVQRHVTMSFKLKILEVFYARDFIIEARHLLAMKMKHEKLDLKKFFELFFLFPQNINLNQFEALLTKTVQLQQNSGAQYCVVGCGFASFDNKSVYLNEDKIIIENELEYESNIRRNRINDEPKYFTDLPYVRIFSLPKKKYFFVHVNEIQAYEFDLRSTDRLILDKKKQQIVNQIFAKKYASFDDIAKNKGQGIILLAVGEPGTGKTSTAEVYSELHKKSLYNLQVEELGIDIQLIEKNLTVILSRINKWNAVLLLDEVDIFLSHRNNNLEKSAIVGVFLRLLEYFDGIIYFTSNRLDVIDHAVISRVTLVLQFPKLCADARKQIWTQNFASAKIKINSVDLLSKKELSGRDIRNYTKLCGYAFDSPVSEDQVLQLMDDFPKN